MTDIVLYGSAEDINGPSATCEIATFEPDPQLDISFDSNTT